MDISIGNAAKLVGRKVKVRITAVAEGVAWAELLSPVEAGDVPLTAEAEAEKPTRARRPSTRKEAAEIVDADEGEEPEEDEFEDEDEESDEDVEEDVEDDDAVGEQVAAGAADANRPPALRRRSGRAVARAAAGTASDRPQPTEPPS